MSKHADLDARILAAVKDGKSDVCSALATREDANDYGCGSSGGFYATPEDAVIAWNRRSPGDPVPNRSPWMKYEFGPFRGE